MVEKLNKFEFFSIFAEFLANFLNFTFGVFLKFSKYQNLLSEVKSSLETLVKNALDKNISEKNIIIDPGIGFSKDINQNLEILRNLNVLKNLNFPILIGASRKRFIGEILNETLSSGTLEIIKKAHDENLDYQVVTIGSDDDPTIGSESFKQTYIKRSSESLQFSKVTDLITKIVNDEGINLILGSSTYLCRDLISFISVDLNSSPVSNVIDFEINGDAVSTINSINGGESLYKSKIASNHSLLLVRPKSFEPADVELNNNFETIEVENSDVAIFDIYKEEKTGPQLEDSKVVISAGRGMVDKENLHSDQIANISYPEFIEDPISTIKNAYMKIGLDMNIKTENSMEKYLSIQKNIQKKKHNYALEEFGLTSQIVKEHFNKYLQTKPF